MININAIKIENRLRKDLGDIDELCNSIREYGLIQPIVITHDLRLIAGERRLKALERLGIEHLEHAKHFIWNEEQDEYRLKAMEFEENLKRKEMSWQEQVLAKAELLKLMQQIHGEPHDGRPRVGETSGFGVAKLAAMLGESLGAVSQDLSVASALQQFPTLARLETKGNALTQLKILGAVASMTVSNKANAKPATERSWTLYECDFRDMQQEGDHTPPKESVDLIWSDLPYGSDIDKMSAHTATSQLASFNDNRLEVLQLLEAIATESFRVLKPDRYAVFCFGFNYYNDLCFELKRVGFNVNPVPCVWIKNTKSGENPTTRYCNGYEPILVCTKGSPCFIRPGLSNVIEIPVEQSKLQAVQKPVALVERFLIDMCTSGATVVDWCCGTGTVGVAAHKLGMKSILFEREASMAMLARTRLEAL